MYRVTLRARATRSEECGQTMAEYAMVLSIITLAIVLTIVAIGDGAGSIIDQVRDALS